MTFVDDDLTAMMADTALSVSVTIGASTTRGYLDWKQVAEKDESGYDTFVNRRTVTIARGALGTITNGTAITVDGGSYVVHDSTREADGKLQEIVLA